MTLVRARHLSLAVAVLVAPFVLSACDSAKKTLGLERQMPDEFKVVTRAPLALPPDYNLRPPEPGAPRPQEVAPRDAARAALTGGPGQAALGSGGVVYQQDGLSSGEVALLQAAGTERAIPDIRGIVNRETSALAEEDQSFTERLLFWRNTEEDEYGKAVDPDGELQRLRENQSLGRPITEGRTPTIERREKGILEGLF